MMTVDKLSSTIWGLAIADLYEVGCSFVDASAVAVAESEGCGVASFDRRIARQTKVPRIEP